MDSELTLTLPHEREILAIVDAAFQAYKADDPNYVAVIITDTHEHVRWLINKLKDSTAWDTNHVKLFRDGVQVKGGGRVIVISANDPGRLMGMTPNRIILMGRLGEMFYWLKGNGIEIEAVA